MGNAKTYKDKAIIRIDGLVHFHSDIENYAKAMKWWNCQFKGNVPNEIKSVWEKVGLNSDWWNKSWYQSEKLKGSADLDRFTNYLKVIHFYRIQGFLAKPYSPEFRSSCSKLWSDDYRQIVTEMKNLTDLFKARSQGKLAQDTDIYGLPFDRILSSIKHEYFN